MREGIKRDGRVIKNRTTKWNAIYFLVEGYFGFINQT